MRHYFLQPGAGKDSAELIGEPAIVAVSALRGRAVRENLRNILISNDAPDFLDQVLFPHNVRPPRGDGNNEPTGILRAGAEPQAVEAGFDPAIRDLKPEEHRHSV